MGIDVCTKFKQILFKLLKDCRRSSSTNATSCTQYRHGDKAHKQERISKRYTHQNFMKSTAAVTNPQPCVVGECQLAV